MTRRLFRFLPFFLLGGCAQGYPAFSSILPDVRLSLIHISEPTRPY